MKNVLKVYDSDEKAQIEKERLFRILSDFGLNVEISGNRIIVDKGLLQYKFISVDSPSQFRGLRYDVVTVDEYVSLTKADKDDLVLGKINQNY
jgi:hypothetical protein